MKAKTKIYPVYVVRDADVGAESVHPSVISAFRKWADADSRFEGVSFVMMTTATEPVQANLYPELRPDGHFYVKPRAKKAVMAPAPFFVERHDLEVTATKHPIEMILAVFMGPEIFKAYGDTDIDEAMELAMYGEEVEDELSLTYIANGGDGPTGLVFSTIDAVFNYPDSDFEETDTHADPENSLHLIINLG